jgi:hypothetical protein
MEGGADKHSKAIRQYKGSHLAEVTKNGVGWNQVKKITAKKNSFVAIFYFLAPQKGNIIIEGAGY